MASPLSDSEIREVLKNAKRIAVIGLSPVAGRPSFGVTRYLIEQGYEIYGIRPGSPPFILERPCVEKLADLKVDVDIIDVFRNSEAIPQLVDEIELWLKDRSRDRYPKILWLQEGVSHPDAEKKAESLGLKVVSNRCILKEHARLI